MTVPVPRLPLFVWFRGRRLSPLLLLVSFVSSRSPCFTASSVDSPEWIWPPSGPLSLDDTNWRLGRCPDGETAAPIGPRRVVAGFSAVALAFVLGLAFVLRLLVIWRRQHLDLVMDTECAPGDDDKRLILPGGVVDGELTTREYNILKLKKDDLKQLCRAYGLNHSGNKDLLQGRLRAFSADQDDWTRLNPEQRRMHRGPKTGKIMKTKSVKPSVRRANEVFRSESTTHVPHLPYRLPDQELPSSQTEANALYEWATAISTAHPYVSKEDQIKAGQARLRKQALSQNYIINPTLAPPQVQGTMSSVGFPHPSFTSTFSIPNSLYGAQHCSCGGAPAVEGVKTPWLPFSASADSLLVPLAAPTSAPLPPPASPSLKNHATRTLKLGDGTCIDFTADEAGPPPAISFADDLPGLDRMWDDRSGNWDGHSALIIKGIPIPIVYWRAVYGRLKSEKSGKAWRIGDWKKIKGSWSEWKLIVERWRQSNETDFWKEFSDSRGNNLNYKAIIRRLTQIRMAEDKKLADEARKAYGTNFSSIFWYKKSGVVYVKTKDRDIAKQYRQELAKLNATESDDMDLESD